MGHTAHCVFSTISIAVCEAVCVCGCGLIIKEVQAKIGLFPSHSFLLLAHSEVKLYLYPQSLSATGLPSTTPILGLRLRHSLGERDRKRLCH